MNEEVLTGGTVNNVTKMGDTVFRSGGPWIEAVHATLNRLEAKGFPYSPRVLGVEVDGREKISFLPGAAMMRPWRPVMLAKHGPIQAAAMLRQFHGATRDLILPSETRWRFGNAAKSADQVIRHGDLGPWNTLWEGDRLTGLVDWDLAEPGFPITDLAQLAYYFIPLRGDRGWREAGFSDAPDYVSRLGAICEAYGAFRPADVINELLSLHSAEARRILQLGKQGRYPWDTWLAGGWIAGIETDRSWLKRELGYLVH
ncbi:MAG: aminoglycoside phosphotransferase family protein [Thermomicrobiales bacterium]